VAVATADADGAVGLWHVVHTAQLAVVEAAVPEVAIAIAALLPSAGDGGGGGGGSGGGGPHRRRLVASLIVQERAGAVVRMAMLRGDAVETDGVGRGSVTGSASRGTADPADTDDDADAGTTGDGDGDGDDDDDDGAPPRRAGGRAPPPPSPAMGFTPARWTPRGWFTPTRASDGKCGLAAAGAAVEVATAPPRGIVTATPDGAFGCQGGEMAVGFEGGTVAVVRATHGWMVPAAVTAPALCRQHPRAVKGRDGRAATRRDAVPETGCSMARLHARASRSKDG